MKKWHWAGVYTLLEVIVLSPFALAGFAASFMFRGLLCGWRIDCSLNDEMDQWLQ